MNVENLEPHARSQLRQAGHGPFGLRSKWKPRFSSYGCERNLRYSPPGFSHSQCSRFRSLLHYNRISWNQSGKPNGGIESYQHAVSFSFPDPSLLTLRNPTCGRSEFGELVDELDRCVEHSGYLEYPQGNPNLPSSMFARRETFGARYATAYGFSKSLTNNPQLDWYEDSQAFNVLHLGISANGYVAGGGGGTQNGYMPSTMAIWAKMPTTSNHSNGTYTFTNAGATGREGPTQAQVNASYAGTNLAGLVTINTQGIQEWTVRLRELTGLKPGERKAEMALIPMPGELDKTHRVKELTWRAVSLLPAVS